MPDKIVYVSAESGIDLMTHLKQVLGEQVVNAELQITQESVDQKVLEWNQKLTPENNSSIDFFKEHNIEIFSLNVKNFDAKQKVMQYIGEKIEFNLAEPEVEEELPLYESQVVDESQIKAEDQVDLAKKEG